MADKQNKGMYGADEAIGTESHHVDVTHVEDDESQEQLSREQEQLRFPIILVHSIAFAKVFGNFQHPGCFAFCKKYDISQGPRTISIHRESGPRVHP